MSSKYSAFRASYSASRSGRPDSEIDNRLLVATALILAGLSLGIFTWLSSDQFLIAIH
ncbi:hypothetical protein [Microvirga flavescens]|uniref:hypothetical protein n=1 Tax=Microvirga flavescens TaxID=2249811 RepID=UPI0013005EFA|nr:hypothetical protein [Microvirga flavescens]